VLACIYTSTASRRTSAGSEVRKVLKLLMLVLAAVLIIGVTHAT
jgi:hypothetical protein